MKYVKFATVTLLVLALSVVAVVAEIDVPKPTSRFFVNDFAGVMDEGAENEIYEAGVQLYEKTGAQVVAVTVDSLDGASIEDYGLALARSWGIGDEERDTGALLILAVQDREVRIEVGYGLEGAITDARSGIILDNYAIPSFAENDFESGMRGAYDAIINEVYLEFGMEADPNYIPADELEEEYPSIGTIILFILLVLLLGFTRRGGLFPWIFLGGHHHHHGGGFGGSSGGFSGGGFRGGGGGFGGGGASRRF